MERQYNKLEAMRTEIKAKIKADYDVKINEMAANQYGWRDNNKIVNIEENMLELVKLWIFGLN